MRLDGTDIQYLLKKKGFSLTDVARQLGITIPGVVLITRGYCRSQRVRGHIETLLGMKPGELEIVKKNSKVLIKVA